jgi:hypothetical protein
MHHEVLTQRNPICHHINTKKGHAESAIRDTCRTSSGCHLLQRLEMSSGYKLPLQGEV